MGLFGFLKANKVKAKVTFSSHDYSPQELQQQQIERASEIRDLIKKSRPSKNGLHPHEIAMLGSAERYKTAGNDFPRYWWYTYAIDAPQKILDMLLKRGFIRQATAKESAEHFKVAELKELLLSFGLETKGKKADLFNRVQEKISEEDLDSKIPIRHYKLTNLGEQELKENEYVAYFGGKIKYGMTVWDMNKAIQDYPHHLFRDLIWRRMNESVNNAMKVLSETGNYYSYYKHEVYIRADMCQFLMEENRHPKDAVRLLAISTYYDVMVVAPFSFYTSLKYRGRNETPPIFREHTHLDYNAKLFSKLQSTLNFSDTEFIDLLVEFFSSLTVRYSMLKEWKIYPINIPVLELARLVVAEMNGEETTAATTYQRIEKYIKSWKG